MKFGVRECADVVLRAKSAQKIGNKIFYKNEPVCYFDTLKTSTFEGAATTVYAQGGRGNARLMSWDGERTVTFTMEDALISPIGLSILTGAGLIEASDDKPVVQHITESLDSTYFNGGSGETKNATKLYVSKLPYEKDNDPTIYVMVLDDHGEVVSEPYLFKPVENSTTTINGSIYYLIEWVDHGYGDADIFNTAAGFTPGTPDTLEGTYYDTKNGKTPSGVKDLTNAQAVLVDYYTAHTSGALQIDITPDKFGGTFYLEASTLWRDQGSGEDLPAEFIIPKCKIQSNFSFTLASSGDPSSFTFTMDAFPDYTRWDPATKVLASIQVIGGAIGAKQEPYRTETWDYDGVVNNFKDQLIDQDQSNP